MNANIEIEESIDFSKAIKNPFAKIAREARKNHGELPPDTSRKMMVEAIKEVHETWTR